MTIYTWPDTRTFVPQQAELRVIDNTQRSLESPMSGYVQTLSMPGARWGWGFDFGAQPMADRDALEAYLLKLSGRQHRVRLWDLKRPRPRGSIQTAGVTLGAAAAQFATTLQLSGCRGANAVLGGSFETDASGDGVGDAWQRYTVGSVGSVSANLQMFADTDHGAYRQYLTASALASTGGARQGVRQVGVRVGHLAGAVATMACSAAATIGTVIRLYIDWYSAAGTLLASADVSAAATGTYQTVQMSFTVPATAATGAVHVWQEQGGGAPAVLHIDAVRLVAGAGSAAYPPAAMLAGGDWLSLANGQLVRVVADAVADDLGRMTVDVRHMLRSAVASGSAITLDRPTALFVRTEAGLVLPRMAGMAAPPLSCEFVEAFA